LGNAKYINVDWCGIYYIGSYSYNSTVCGVVNILYERKVKKMVRACFGSTEYSTVSNICKACMNKIECIKVYPKKEKKKKGVKKNGNAK
jgi:hypothetical protein